VNLAGPALADVPPGVSVPWAVPVLADRGSDSDPLREDLALGGFGLLAPHRSNRAKPPTADGRKLRRCKRRWLIERSFAWVKAFRRVATRYEVKAHLYDGFVALACAFIALGRL
jgi:transposase